MNFKTAFLRQSRP